MTYDVVTTIGTALLLIWLFYWLFNPYKCSCSKLIWTKHGMRKHLQTPHKWEK